MCTYTDTQSKKDIFEIARDDMSFTVSSNATSAYSYEKIKETVSKLEKEIIEKSKKENCFGIKKYEILSPNKVIRVTFNDGTQEKVVCCKEDDFNLKRGLFIAISKHLYKDKYTLEGIEVKATELSYLKKYDSMVNKAIKEHDKLEKEKAERAKREKELKKLEHEKRMKKDKKNRDNKVKIQKEAYLKAMLDFSDIKGE